MTSLPDHCITLSSLWLKPRLCCSCFRVYLIIYPGVRKILNLFCDIYILSCNIEHLRKTSCLHFLLAEKVQSSLCWKVTFRDSALAGCSGYRFKQALEVTCRGKKQTCAFFISFGWLQTIWRVLKANCFYFFPLPVFFFGNWSRGTPEDWGGCRSAAVCAKPLGKLQQLGGAWTFN